MIQHHISTKINLYLRQSLLFFCIPSESELFCQKGKSPDSSSSYLPSSRISPVISWFSSLSQQRWLFWHFTRFLIKYFVHPSDYSIFIVATNKYIISYFSFYINSFSVKYEISEHFILKPGYFPPVYHYRFLK